MAPGLLGARGVNSTGFGLNPAIFVAVMPEDRTGIFFNFVIAFIRGKCIFGLNRIKSNIPGAIREVLFFMVQIRKS